MNLSSVNNTASPSSHSPLSPPIVAVKYVTANVMTSQATTNVMTSDAASEYNVTSFVHTTGSNSYPVTVRQGVVYALVCVIAVVFIGLVLCAVRYNRKRRHGFLHVHPKSINSSTTSASSCELTPGIVTANRRKKDDSRHILDGSPDDNDVKLPRLANMSNIVLDWPTPLYKKINDWTPVSMEIRSSEQENQPNKESVVEKLANDIVECETRPANDRASMEASMEVQPTNNCTEDTSIPINTFIEVHSTNIPGGNDNMQLLTNDANAPESYKIESSYEHEISFVDSATSTPLSIMHM